MVRKNAASLLWAMELQHEGLIVDDLKAYKAKAVDLGKNPQARRALVKKIKQSRYLELSPDYKGTEGMIPPQVDGALV
jgi:predicted O-linked N-acetylglucosamine transferase (SPINDLY family)